MNKSQLSLLLFVLVVFCVIITKNRFDYNQYLIQWYYYLQDGNPWRWGSNTYGPLHGLFAYPSILWDKLPRLIFAISSFAVNAYLINELDYNLKSKILLLVILNPLFWIFIVVFGCNDGLVASSIFFSIILHSHKRYALSALCISLGILMKFIPIIAVPFLMMNRKKIYFKFSFYTLFFLTFGIITSYLLWTNKIFHPFRYSDAREAKILSIFRYLGGEFSPIDKLNVHLENTVSVVIVMSGLTIIFLLIYISTLIR